MIRTEAHWWSETPEGEVVAEYNSPHEWGQGMDEARRRGRKLIFHSKEVYETGTGD